VRQGRGHVTNACISAHIVHYTRTHAHTHTHTHTRTRTQVKGKAKGMRGAKALQQGGGAKGGNTGGVFKGRRLGGQQFSLNRLQSCAQSSGSRFNTLLLPRPPAQAAPPSAPSAAANAPPWPRARRPAWPRRASSRLLMVRGAGRNTCNNFPPSTRVENFVEEVELGVERPDLPP